MPNDKDLKIQRAIQLLERTTESLEGLKGSVEHIEEWVRNTTTPTFKTEASEHPDDYEAYMARLSALVDGVERNLAATSNVLRSVRGLLDDVRGNGGG